MNTIRNFLKNKQLLLLIAFLPTCFLHAQKVGIKTNTLYLATTTPNLGIEVATSNSFTLSLTAGYNPFSFPSRENTDGRKIHPKLKHWLIMPEVKYWFCKSFQRGYLGLHGIYADYNIGGFPKPRVFDDTRYKGQAYGGGLSYGYQWAIGDRWGMEASVGVGYLYLKYKKYECTECGDYLGKFHRNYFGPTKLALSFIYYLK